jgi:NADP-dependent aldehyde dehydrogenase
LSARPVLLRGEWRASQGTQTFQAVNPATTEKLADAFPISPLPEVETAVEAASLAAEQLQGANRELFATFLESYAANIEARSDALVEAAHRETALSVSTR